MLLEIRRYGDPILRKKCEPIAKITEEVVQLAKDMIETMLHVNGLGLAAPQVGRSLRMFVLREYIEEKDGKFSLSDPKIYINPKLSNPSEYILTDVEGCLSLPGLRLDVDRPEKITIEAIDLEGKPFVEHLEGYNARIRMHENDHINGVLFIDRVDPKTRKKIEPLLHQIKKSSS